MKNWIYLASAIFSISLTLAIMRFVPRGFMRPADSISMSSLSTRQVSGSASLSSYSQNEESLVQQPSIIDSVKRLFSSSEKSESCEHKCIIKGQSVSAIYYDDVSKCSPAQLVWHNSFGSLRQEFSAERSNSTAEFEKKCILYGMRLYDQKVEVTGEAPRFGVCNSALHKIDEIAPPCMTDIYVNVINNIFVDVMNCTELSQRHWLYVLLYESGMHPGAISAKNNHFGISQLSNADLLSAEDIEKQLSFYSEASAGQTKIACSKILKSKSSWSNFDKNSCSLLEIGRNPLGSLVQWAIRIKSLETKLRQDARRVMALQTIEFGARSPQMSREKLDQYTLIIASKKGVETAVRILEDYIKYEPHYTLETFYDYLARRNYADLALYFRGLNKFAEELDRAFGKYSCSL